MTVDPTEILDRAVAQEPGKGIRLAFVSSDDARRFRLRLQSAMGVAARRAKTDFEPDDPAWGLHPWRGVVIKLWNGAGQGHTLWVGVPLPPKVEEGVEPSG